MGLLSRKRPGHEPRLSPTRLRSLPEGDLFLLLETGLMNAYGRLRDYRTVPVPERRAALEWMRADLEQVFQALDEASSRI